MNSYMKQQDDIDARMNKLIVDHCPSDTIPDHTIYSPGSGPVQVFKEFNDKLSEAAARQTNSDAPSPAPQDVNVLWTNWMNIAEILFIQLTKFAKLIPGFSDLHIDDRIVLLKAARIEVTTFMA